MNFWGNSPDMNPVENIGVIIKDKVEELTTSEDHRDRYNYDILKFFHKTYFQAISIFNKLAALKAAI